MQDNPFFSLDEVGVLFLCKGYSQRIINPTNRAFSILVIQTINEKFPVQPKRNGQESWNVHAC